MKSELTREEIEERIKKAEQAVRDCEQEVQWAKDDLKNAEDNLWELKEALDEKPVVKPMPSMRDWCKQKGMKVV